MLKTNSKKAIQNIRQYILDNYDGEGYGPKEAAATTFEEVAKCILDTAQAEKSYLVNRVSLFEIFDDWTRGLPSILDCSYYLCAGKKDLGDLLEETEEERDKYSETEAQDCLTRLIFRELEKVYR